MQTPEHVATTAARMRAELCGCDPPASSCKIKPSTLKTAMGSAATPHLHALTKLSSSCVLVGGGKVKPTPSPALGLRFPDGRDGHDTFVFVPHYADEPPASAELETDAQPNAPVSAPPELWVAYTNSRMQTSTAMRIGPTHLASRTFPSPYMLELRTAALRAALAATPPRDCTYARHAPTPVKLTVRTPDPFYLPAVPDYSKTPYEQLAATYSTLRTPATLTPADYENIMLAAHSAGVWAPVELVGFSSVLEQHGHAPEPVLATLRLPEPNACTYTWARVETRPSKERPAATHLALVVRLPHLRLSTVLFEANVATGAAAMIDPYSAPELELLRRIC